MKTLALVMSSLYVLVGCVFIFTDLLGEEIPRFRLPLGLMLVGYGVVRAYLWRRKYVTDTSEQADPTEAE